MYIYEFLLEKFKPLMHNSIHRIHVSNISQITILVGPNGWGKSSILRELTPYPATRSDYEKNGKKVLCITHDKSNYVLTSDFSKTNAHSFIKDDVELNLSGTSDVQTDLVNTSFEYSKLLASLLLGTSKITAMGRPARRELFMSTYPGSLSFVLNHFNRLSTMLRSLTSQLKLLKERQTVLKNKLIEPSTLQMYTELKQDLDKVVLQLDQNLFMCTNLLNSTKQTIEGYKDYDKVDIGYFNNSIHDLQKELEALKSTPGYDIISGHSLQTAIQYTNNTLQALASEHKALMQTGSNLKEDIEKYNQYLATDVESSIQRCESIIAMQEQLLKDRAVDDSIPTMDRETVSYIKQHLPLIEETVQWLAAFGEHWDDKTYEDKKLEYAKVKMDISNLETKHTSTLNTMGLLTTQLKVSGYDSYPKDCKTVCKLKSNVQETAKQLQKEIESLTQEKDKTHSELTRLKKVADELNKSLQGRPTASEKIALLRRLISNYSWGFFVCNNLDLISALNTNSSELWNRLLRVIKNSENAIVVKQANETLEVTRAKLESLKLTDIPAKALITEALISKEVELNNLHKKLESIEKKGRILKIKKTGYTEQASLVRRIQELKNKLKTWVEYKKLEADMEVLKNISSNLTEQKVQANNKLVSIESILVEQRGYLTILNDELAPTMEDLNTRIDHLTWITEQLSPTSGIPYKYSIQYINEIFKLANKFIRHIWEYDLELVYFKDQDAFDFIFKLLINNSSELKDINMCSKGQKSLIDLVVNLAICIYRNYAQSYPLKLDEIDDGMTPSHQAKLTEFLGELLQQNTINQVFIMNHQLAVSSSFHDAGVISLSNEDSIPSNCRVISKVN